MIITISGKPGSGKSIIGKELARKLNYKYVSIGEIFKKLAKQKKMDLLEFSKYRKENFEIDQKIDEEQKQINRDCVLDSRLGFYFSNPDLKIYLKAPVEVRIKRIAKRDNLSFEEAKKQIKKREETDRKIYKKLYSIDIQKLENYDLIIDTDKFNIEQIVKMVCSLVESYKK